LPGLNLTRMQTESREAREALGTPPLTLPRELWVKLSSEHQAACRSAEGLLEIFTDEGTLPLRDMFTRAKLGAEDALAGLRILQGMELVSVEATENGPLVKLVALPEEHVRIVGPDGQVRWLLVARPVEAPEIEPSQLN
jgi:hypothetical protein